MKIICYAVAPLEKHFIMEWAQKNNVEVKTVREELSRDNVNLAKDFDGVSSEGITPVDSSVYAAFKNFGIKQLAIRQVGVDNQDIQSARMHGITLTNVSVYSPRTIAEMGITQAMYLLRKIGIYRNRMAQGNFKFDETTMSTELFNCTVGLVGAGHIGGATAQIYKALGANVLTYDPFYDASLEPFTTYVDFDTLVENSDIISLHTPLLPTTKNIINAQVLKKMKRNSILINMARGELVETNALIAALEKGEIAVAGVDTLSNEFEFFGKENVVTPPIEYEKLRKLPNVLITPHVAFFTELAIKNSIEIALNDAKTIINGGKSKNIVN